MSEADKMFEELGYIKIVRYAGYAYYNEDDGNYIYIHNNNLVEITQMDGGYAGFGYEELNKVARAINRKIKEMRCNGEI